MLRLALEKNQTAFEPGEEIAGTAEWQFEDRPKGITVELVWFTRGKGSEDADVAQTIRFDAPQAREQRPFRLRAAAEPYSFSGKLISLVWAVELRAEETDESERIEIIIAPKKQEIVLSALPAEPPLGSGLLTAR